MREAIHTALKPVRSRQQMMFALRSAVAGVTAGAAVALALGAARLLFGLDVSWLVGAAVLAAGPVLGLLVGLVLRHGWHDAAAAVDAHHGLKDRAVTALAFTDLPAPTELQSVAVSDALGHLNAVEPRAVVPLRAPRAWPVALAALAAAVIVLAIPLAQREVDAGPAPAPAHIRDTGKRTEEQLAKVEKKLTETIQDIDDEKADDEKKGFEDLFKKLAEKVKELQEPGTDEKEALAKLSEMQAAVKALANELNVAALDGAMSSLGTALAASTAFEGAGKALQDGKLEKAVKELEKVEEVKLTPKEAKALEEKLKQLAKQMGDAGQGSLSDAVAELAEALKGGNGKVGQAAKALAKKLNNAVKRKKANDLLTALNEDLKESKCNCQNNGGPRIRQAQKSDSPSSTWGRAISGNTDGEKTKLPGKRVDQQITGTPGAEGESDVETTATPEARQQASREYKDRHKEFSRESEAVIDGEPIPLGHRQMVKKYFELIRPSNADAPDKKPAEPEKK
jgi:hypothetical protein